MPIIRPMPPANAAAAFAGGLLSFLAGPDAGAAGTVAGEHFVGLHPRIPSTADLGLPATGVDPNTIGAYNPQQIFKWGIHDIVGNSGLSAARFAGWRFIIDNASTNTAVMAQVARRPPTSNWKMIAAFHGGQVQQILSASRLLDSLSQVQKGLFELRVLVVAGLNLEAFWLVARSASDTDLLVPAPLGVVPAVPGLHPGTTYPASAFLGAILPSARAVAAAGATYGR